LSQPSLSGPAPAALDGPFHREQAGQP
jgi:hypothetical protein